MRRLFFLAPDVSSAHALVDSLLLARITDKHIHVLAREGTPLGDLPEAGVAQRSDLIPALERGAAAGGATGLVAGLVAIALPGMAIIPAGGIVIALAAAGALVGSWASSLVGVSVSSSRLERFKEAIASGQVLVMADVAHEQVQGILDRMKECCPNVASEGMDTDIPAFP
ncbi:hypothetical protein [Thiomonas bhubaneswarensis]|uniref:DUF1269 domain-containing protein n=1 Tax=Thiomonas bhubaneswarensis TaxID=339866 RepID=A0A0K6HVM5_9BURK|nr:hypothetical protein [Thiomonas bhubaneswarensis]CUA94969.1 hypothetical protein Ga0061069_102285 [Thiomonas bhubaneswarensis]